MKNKTNDMGLLIKDFKKNRYPLLNAIMALEAMGGMGLATTFWAILSKADISVLILGVIMLSIGAIGGYLLYLRILRKGFGIDFNKK